MSFDYILYLLCCLVVMLRINIIYMSKLDKDIFYYLLVKTDNSLLHKYRDYFPSCNKIPKGFDKLIFLIVYILYIPIISCIIIWKHLKNIFHDLKQHINHPLLLSKGMAYNAILPYLTENSNLTPTTFNKIYWDKLFRKLKIDTPEIIGVIKDGSIKYKKKYDKTPNTHKYIIKEVYGCCGNSVRMFDDNIPKTGYYVIQKYVGNNNLTYRIITNSLNNTINVLEIYSLNNNTSFITNINKGGKMTLITDVNNDIIKRGIDECVKLHTYINKTHKCNTIGWDIIIKDDKLYFLEGNIGVSVNNQNYIKYVEHFYRNNV